ncbi:MAG: GTP cyclohydrolase I, partial [Candidatus Binatia bacterium]
MSAKPDDSPKPEACESSEEHVRAILVALGEDPDREGLVKTPARVMRAFRYFTKGYVEDPRAVIGDAMFTENYSEMIIVK